MKKIGILLILLCALSTLAPINAQTITQEIGNNTDGYDTTVFTYPRGTDWSQGVLEVVSGETAHITVELFAPDAPKSAVSNQVIKIMIMQYVNGTWKKITNQAFPDAVVTLEDGKTDFDIFTFKLKPGVYKIDAYYPGNLNDSNTDPNNKLKPGRNSNGGIWVYPPQYIDPICDDDNNEGNI